MHPALTPQLLILSLLENSSTTRHVHVTTVRNSLHHVTDFVVRHIHRDCSGLIHLDKDLDRPVSPHLCAFSPLLSFWSFSGLLPNPSRPHQLARSPFAAPPPFHPFSFLSLVVFPSSFLSVHQLHFLRLRPSLSHSSLTVLLPILSSPSVLWSLLAFVDACRAAAAWHSAAV